MSGAAPPIYRYSNVLHIGLFSLYIRSLLTQVPTRFPLSVLEHSFFSCLFFLQSSSNADLPPPKLPQRQRRPQRTHLQEEQEQ